MAKAEIGWTRTDEDGIKRDVYAHRVGDRWLFYSRTRRYECWQLMENPPLEDWQALLDAVERRLTRRLVRPEEVGRIRRAIQDRFPEVKLP
jgi:hypothetical protein